MQTTVFRPAAVFPWTLLLAAFLGCKSPAQNDPPAGLINLYEGPVTTFHRSCSPCHGENGSQYTTDFHALSDADLADKINSMMNGPARITAPSPEEIHAMIAYHHALRDQSLFLMVSNPAAVLEDGHTVLKGNVTPGAAVELRQGETVLPATVTGGEWILENVPPPPFVLAAKKDNLETSFPFPERQFNEL
ncbi:MAG: cytochrome c [bacterium]